MTVRGGEMMKKKKKQLSAGNRGARGAEVLKVLIYV